MPDQEKLSYKILRTMRSLISKYHATANRTTKTHRWVGRCGALLWWWCGFCYAPITIKTSQRKLRPPAKPTLGNGNQENKKNGAQMKSKPG